LRAQLTPLIGENGFGALVGRSVRLVAPEFAFLAMEAPPKTSDQWFAALEQRLSTVEPDVARAADAALMNAFIRQLTGLIGAALTRRLLAAVSDGSDGHDLDRSTGK
jgi:hypothetical protein